MLLAELYKLSRLGAEKPLSFWLPEYNRIRTTAAAQLQTIASQLHETKTKQKIKKLIGLLSQKDPNEFELTESLMTLAEIIEKEKTPTKLSDLEKKFIQTTKNFSKLAKLKKNFAEKNKKLVNNLSKGQCDQYDLRLLQNEGMMYCLEYYLVLYKTLTETPDPVNKKKIFENQEINIDSADLPGLWVDFNGLEVLEKIIYPVLDDELREKLTAAYFEARNKILKIKTNETFTYQDCSLEEAIENLKKLIIIFFEAFQTKGIEKLSSRLLTPYGKQPRISDIKL
ncbi:MAG: hypothetical protein V1716_02475 [Candidatus Uhrbacteria bacterium]